MPVILERRGHPGTFLGLVLRWVIQHCIQLLAGNVTTHPSVDQASVFVAVVQSCSRAVVSRGCSRRAARASLGHSDVAARRCSVPYSSSAAFQSINVSH
eukprot:5432380-Prymnesium_polylepis.1